VSGLGLYRSPPEPLATRQRNKNASGPEGRLAFELLTATRDGRMVHLKRCVSNLKRCFPCRRFGLRFHTHCGGFNKTKGMIVDKVFRFAP
jgi:hypothetical protein